MEVLDLRVGRVARHQVRLMIDERAVEEAEVHDADLLEAYPVEALETGVAVGALLELVAEGGAPLARNGNGIRDRADARPILATDHEHEGVVEAERPGPHEPRRRVCLAHAGQHPLRIALRPILQHRGQRRPRVLDVRVDLPRADRRVADERAAEVEPALRPEPHVLDRLREQLAEDALLGEVLRADDDALAAAPAAGEQGEQHCRPSHRGGRSARSTTPSATSAPIASSAAGRAPARIIRSSTIATPRKMKTPSPPAPIDTATSTTCRPVSAATSRRRSGLTPHPPRGTLAPRGPRSSPAPPACRPPAAARRPAARSGPPRAPPRACRASRRSPSCGAAPAVRGTRAAARSG